MDEQTETIAEESRTSETTTHEKAKSEKSGEDGGASQKKDGQGSTTIFDDVFHTIAQNLPQLLIALINLCFGTNYPYDVEYQHIRNEHFHKSGKTISDYALIVGGITYHFECQIKAGSIMVFRMLEYDFLIAFEQAWLNHSKELTLPFSCVLYLRPAKETPDEYSMRIKNSDGESMPYRCKILKAQNYTLDELFEKNLLALLPFYIMRYEAQFSKMEEDEALRARFLAEVETLSVRLEAAISPEEKAVVYPDLMKLITDIAEHELREYQNTLKGVKEIMGGRILPLPSDSIRKAREEGREEGRAEGREEGRAEERNNIFRNMYDRGTSILNIAEMTGETVATVTSGLRVQGIAV